MTYTFIELPKEKRIKEVKEEGLHFPKEFDKFLLADHISLAKDDELSNEAYVQIVAYNDQTYILNDLNGICYWWGTWGTAGYSPFRNRETISDIISSVTGLDIDEAEATKIARRTITLVRAYNIREGVKRDRVKDSMPSYIQPNRNQVERWIDRFYELNGRNKDGVPTAETLTELGLDDVRQDLEQRGNLVKKEVSVV